MKNNPEFPLLQELLPVEPGDSFKNGQCSMKAMFLNEITQICINNRMYTFSVGKQYMVHYPAVTTESTTTPDISEDQLQSIM